MTIEKFADHEALSEAVADYIVARVRQKPNLLMVLTSGDTPKLAYRKMAEKLTPQEFTNVRIIGLDEWVGVPPESEGSCRYIVEENLLKLLDVPSANYTFFDSMSDDLQAECQRIDDLILANGGLDFILVGLGVNGHIGLNEPGASFEAYCQVTELDPLTVSIGQKYFQSSTPLTQGITVGLKHLLEASEAMVIASGTGKAEIIKRLVEENINEKLPATCLKLHPHGMLWIDEAAAAKIL